MIRASEARCGRAKSASAREFMVIQLVLLDSAAQSAIFDMARKAARTSCEGLLDGSRFESTAGRAAA
jgi:hypothetical protein